MSRPNTVFVGVKGTLLGETTKAVKFSVSEVNGEIFDPPAMHWFPFSQIEKIFKDAQSVGNDSLMVSEWICKEKGLI